MKKIHQLLTCTILLIIGFVFNANAKEDARIVNMQVGYSYYIGGYNLRIDRLDTPFKGNGTLYFEALDMHLNVDFEDLMITDLGNHLSGEIRTSGGSRLADITEALTEIQGISLPEDSKVFLKGFHKNVSGAFIDLDMDARTVVEGEYLSFSKQDIYVQSNEICLQGVDMDMVDDGKINDFQFPLRILAGDPDDEKQGSYITFDCKGFKNFNLSAVYDFPKKQLKPYIVKPSDGGSSTTKPKTKQDTVRAYFTINAPTLKSFIVTGSIDPFQVPGVDDMGFTAKDVVIDYSDTTNFDGFKYIDKTTKKPVDNKWKGIYIKKVQMYLPKSITSFNKGKVMTAGVNDLVYDRGNGISFVAEATNLLSITNGNVNGWGVSIDTLDVRVQYNSFEKMRLNGKIFIPIMGKGDNIGYEASVGKKDTVNTINFSLHVGGTYHLPFLSDSSKIVMKKSSKAGLNYVGGKYEPYADISGDIQLTIKVKGVPEVKIPKLGVENLSLGDIISSVKTGVSAAKQGYKDVSKMSSKEITGGLDKLAIKAFSFAGLKYKVEGDKPDSKSSDTKKDDKNDKEELGEKTEKKEGEQSKVSGFPISIKSWSFKSDTIDKKVKVLRAEFKINMSGSGGGGISGDADLGIAAQLDYAKVISKTPWKAFQYKELRLNQIAVKAKVGNVAIAGAIKFINKDKVYGNGFKGGFKMTLDGSGGFAISAVGQFGRTLKSSNKGPDDRYRFFFVEAEIRKNTEFFGMWGLGVYGFKGGVFYNMTQLDETNPIAKADRVLSPIPGYGMSTYKYVPKKGSHGLKAGIIVGMQGSPKVFCGDVLLGVEIKIIKGKFSVSKITIEGNLSLMAESIVKMDEAPIIVSASMMIDLDKGLMTAIVKGSMTLPKKKPVFKGSLNASMQLDLNKKDNKKYKNYVAIGTPTKKLTLEFVGSKSVDFDCSTFFMLGEWPESLPKYPDAKSGVALGFKMTAKADIKAGPLYAKMNGDVDLEGVFSEDITPSCLYYDRNDYGVNGMYLKSSLNVNLKFDVGVRYNLSFIGSGSVSICKASAKTTINAEMPNPTKLEGFVKVKGSAIGGLVKVSASMKFSLGDKCSPDNGKIDAASIAGFDAGCFKDASTNMYYFFKGKYCFIRKQGGSFRRYYISETFRGLPEDLDGAVFLRKNGKYYFFKGYQYWSKKVGKSVRGPWPIRAGWGSNQFVNIDFAVATTNNVYLFKNGRHRGDGWKNSRGDWWFGYDSRYYKKIQAGVCMSDGNHILYLFRDNQYMEGDWKHSRPKNWSGMKPIQGNW